MLRRPFSLAILTFGLAACDGPGEGRSVILVTLDTTRADRLGAYGRPDVRTPAFDRLARQGALFRDAIADVPITLPSHSTMFTGYPSLVHGVRYNADLRLTDDAETVAEELSSKGWRTAAVVSSLVLLDKFGLDQGFDDYDDELEPGYTKHDESRFTDRDHWLPKGDRRAEEAVDRALSWLERSASPFFFWLHVYDAHFPYDPPPPWSATHADPYLAEIQYVDRHLRRVARWVEGRDDVALVVSADHGEGLDEHREDGHGIFVYDDTIRVPLAVRDPARIPGGRLIDGQARTVDFGPTLLALAGRPGEWGIGENLLPVAAGDAPPPDSPAYSESIKTRIFYGGSGLKSVRTGAAKYVLAPRPELYDLESDPGETRDLLSVDPDRAADVRRQLERTVRELTELSHSSVEPANADPKVLAKLRSLGYLSGGEGDSGPGSFESEMRMVGNDPKDLVDVSMSAQMIENGYYERGEQKLRRFFATARSPEGDPAVARLWAAAHLNYAKVWMIREDFLEAAAEYRRATIVDPDYEKARWSLVYALNLAGETERAEREGAALLEKYPRAWRVRLHRGLSLAMLGRTSAAREELDLIVRDAPGDHAAVKSAAYYRDRLGTPEEPAVLDRYAKRSDGAADS